MKKPIDNYVQQMERLYFSQKPKIKTITMQITDACNLCCTYCYQIDKHNNIMTFDTAKNFLNLLLEGKNDYINLENTTGIVLDLIGGEPLLAVDLIYDIIDYILSKMIIENHPWLKQFRVSICSNGQLYFHPKFQECLKKFNFWISYEISIDGNKELHDKCRIYPDGSGSYDNAVKAMQHYSQTYKQGMGSKVTLSPENIIYMNEALKGLINLGYTDLYANCIYEDVWSIKEAKILYHQLKEFSDYILDNNLEHKIYCSLFQENGFVPQGDTQDQNWCGGNGQMLAINYTGNLYPCLRYMESSLGNDAEAIIIGNYKSGIGNTEKEQKWIKELQSMTRKSQSDEECLNCQIAEGCGWCSALNYQCWGKLNKRTKHLCQMHQARALGNYYYWNKYYQKNNIKKKKQIYIIKEWALNIIDEKEWEYLQKLSNTE